MYINNQSTPGLIWKQSIDFIQPLPLHLLFNLYLNLNGIIVSIMLRAQKNNNKQQQKTNQST